MTEKSLVLTKLLKAKYYKCSSKWQVTRSSGNRWHTNATVYMNIRYEKFYEFSINFNAGFQTNKKTTVKQDYKTLMDFPVLFCLYPISLSLSLSLHLYSLELSCFQCNSLSVSLSLHGSCFNFYFIHCVLQL